MLGETVGSGNGMAVSGKAGLTVASEGSTLDAVVGDAVTPVVDGMLGVAYGGRVSSSLVLDGTVGPGLGLNTGNSSGAECSLLGADLELRIAVGWKFGSIVSEDTVGSRHGSELALARGALIGLRFGTRLETAAPGIPICALVVPELEHSVGAGGTAGKSVGASLASSVEFSSSLALGALVSAVNPRGWVFCGSSSICSVCDIDS